MLVALLVALAAAQTPPPEPLPPDMVPVEPPRPVAEGEKPPEAQPEQPAAPVAVPEEVGPRRQLSLLSAEPLGGGSAALAWAGWQSLGAMWAQGVTQRDDLGASLDFDWALTELRLGGFFRRSLGKAGTFDMAGRLALAWFANFGGDWIEEGNRNDRGIEVTPSLVFSRRGGNGVFSVFGDLPLTVTWRHDGGVLFIPRLSASYETPLYDELTVGVRAGFAYRAGTDSVPLNDRGGELQFLVLVGYQVF